MELSKEILSFLHWLDSNKLTFDSEYIQDMLIDLEEKEKDGLERYIAIRLMIRKIISKYFKSKSAPIIESVEELKELLSDISGIDELGELIDEFSEAADEDYLNTYFTEKSLSEVPKYVNRLRKLSTLKVGRAPGKKVENYFRQATNCYIYGLYDAVATLSRTVLQFTLEEALKKKKCIILPVGNEGYIERLISIAEMALILNRENALLANNIRKIGNKAIHNNSTNEIEACQVIQDTAIIISKIYSN